MGHPPQHTYLSSPHKALSHALGEQSMGGHGFAHVGPPGAARSQMPAEDTEPPRASSFFTRWLLTRDVLTRRARISQPWSHGQEGEAGAEWHLSVCIASPGFVSAPRTQMRRIRSSPPGTQLSTAGLPASSARWLRCPPPSSRDVPGRPPRRAPPPPRHVDAQAFRPSPRGCAFKKA